MPNPEKPAGLSSIRERSLKQLLARRDAYLEKAEDTLTALQDRRSLGLSPLDLELQRQALAFHQSRIVETDGLIKQIRKQNAAIEADRAANPMRPAARRNPSNAAILGLLERERRRTATLSRGAYARAQAVAASRSKFDIKSAYRRGSVSPGVSTSFGPEHLRGVDVDTSFVDPCVEYERKQRNRREVMFAQGTARRGYRVPHARNPC